ncbi:MAG: hypothetical protein P1P85_03955 [Patescibacteria group bacterium]|nr:hypothetical protein [Patescibacteria group bacterium]
MKTKNRILLVIGLLILILVIVEVYILKKEDCHLFKINLDEEYVIPESNYSFKLKTMSYILIPRFYPYGLADVSIKENGNIIKSFQIKGDSDCFFCRDPVKVKEFILYLKKVDKEDKKFGQFEICFD